VRKSHQYSLRLCCHGLLFLLLDVGFVGTFRRYEEWLFSYVGSLEETSISDDVFFGHLLHPCVCYFSILALISLVEKDHNQLSAVLGLKTLDCQAVPIEGMTQDTCDDQLSKLDSSYVLYQGSPSPILTR